MFHSFVFCCLCFWRLVVFADGAEKIISEMEGHSVTLESNLNELQEHDLITWRFEPLNTKIAEIDKDKNIFSIYDDVPDGRFRGRLKLDHQTGSLTITHTNTTDSGLYHVTISRTGGRTAIRFNVTVYGPSDPSANLTALISAAAAAGFLLLILAVVIFFICRKHRKTEPQVEPREEEVTYADTTFHKRNEPQSSAKQEEDVVYAGVVTRR
ncbi:uncharacterized protein LOC120486640 [Pimephales promelas]|uniref:uncharacterized protein LOC120486640 n=1 Tax=Pimephales promelas TaxID=90988 RepID=UPI0019559E8B|nr:uncharacterized protein LOC120486640 [Pimephales promelas]